ncbi:MAG: A/G-specific adenine glycosylase, partial [Prevotella sp.]|nr:A/G-specific adenine glycosylase [Prevotella sp.]
MSPFPHLLLQWYAANGRSLPWRDSSDPYAIWLSEVILQQTRIEQGRPYWERFMKRWPTVNDLAAA